MVSFLLEVLMFGKKYYLIAAGPNPITLFIYVIVGFSFLLFAQVAIPIVMCILVILFLYEIWDMKNWHKIKHNGILDLILAASAFRLMVYLLLFFIFFCVPLIFLISIRNYNFRSWVTEEISFLTWLSIGFVILFGYIYILKRVKAKKFSHYKRKEVMERRKARETIAKTKKQISNFASGVSKYYFK